MARFVMALLLAVVSASVRAEAVADPMRPPAGFADPQLSDGGAQGVRLIKTQRGRRSALVGGVLLREGEKVGDATIQSIDEQGVTLVYPDGVVEKLGLFAGVERRLLPATKHQSRKP